MQGVALLDIAASGERQAHHDGGVGLLGNLEVEVPGADRLAGIDVQRIFRRAGLEEIQRGAVIILVVLDLHRIGLGALGGELDAELAVLQRHDPGGGVGSRLQGGILVDRKRGGRRGGGLALRQGRDALRLGGLQGQGLGARYGVELRLQLGLLAHLTGLEDGKADEDGGYENKTDD